MHPHITIPKKMCTNIADICRKHLNVITSLEYCSHIWAETLAVIRFQFWHFLLSKLSQKFIRLETCWNFCRIRSLFCLTSVAWVFQDILMWLQVFFLFWFVMIIYWLPDLYIKDVLMKHHLVRYCNVVTKIADFSHK